MPFLNIQLRHRHRPPASSGAIRNGLSSIAPTSAVRRAASARRASVAVPPSAPPPPPSSTACVASAVAAHSARRYARDGASRDTPMYTASRSRPTRATNSAASSATFACRGRRRLAAPLMMLLACSRRALLHPFQRLACRLCVATGAAHATRVFIVKRTRAAGAHSVRRTRHRRRRLPAHRLQAHPALPSLAAPHRRHHSIRTTSCSPHRQCSHHRHARAGASLATAAHTARTPGARVASSADHHRRP